MTTAHTETPELFEASVQNIAAGLNESQPAPLDQIKRIVEVLGSEAAIQLLEKTHQTEAEGGLTIADGSRQRTPGGVFFYYARRQLKPEGRRYVWPNLNKPATPPFEWAERFDVVRQLVAAAGEARTAKITLLGRPGRVVIKGDVVLTSIPNARKVPPLPRGLPDPPPDQPPYIVYVTAKQWRKVADAIKNPADILIVEGYPTFDQRLKALTVFATNITTKLLQRSKREGQADS
jgi:hypothetical protein